MPYDLKTARSKLDQKKGQVLQIEESINTCNDKIINLEKEGKDIEESCFIIQEVAKQTQSLLEYHVSELVSLALNAVFPDPYQLHLDFVSKRNKTEAELSFSKDNENKIHPYDSSGGGVIDVASFALRISLWSLQKPRNRPLLILDEPFKNVNDPSRILHEKTAKMIKEICDKLHLQIIIVTLMPELIEYSDNVIEIKKVKEVSEVISDKKKKRIRGE